MVYAELHLSKHLITISLGAREHLADRADLFRLAAEVCDLVHRFGASGNVYVLTDEVAVELASGQDCIELFELIGTIGNSANAEERAQAFPSEPVQIN